MSQKSSTHLAVLCVLALTSSSSAWAAPAHEPERILGWVEGGSPNLVMTDFVEVELIREFDTKNSKVTHVGARFAVEVAPTDCHYGFASQGIVGVTDQLPAPVESMDLKIGFSGFAPAPGQVPATCDPIRPAEIGFVIPLATLAPGADGKAAYSPLAANRRIEIHAARGKIYKYAISFDAKSGAFRVDAE